jgi:hypothetical protein
METLGGWSLGSIIQQGECHYNGVLSLLYYQLFQIIRCHAPGYHHTGKTILQLGHGSHGHSKYKNLYRMSWSSNIQMKHG